MGSYNVLCAISNINITDGDEMKMLYVSAANRTDDMTENYNHFVWQVLSLPVSGYYRDGGNMTMEKDFNFNLLNGAIMPFITGKVDYATQCLGTMWKDGAYFPAIYMHKAAYDSVVAIGKQYGNGCGRDVTEDVLKQLELECAKFKKDSLQNERMERDFPGEESMQKDTFNSLCHRITLAWDDPTGYPLYCLGSQDTTGGTPFTILLTRLLRELIIQEWNHSIYDITPIIEPFMEMYHFILGLSHLGKTLIPPKAGSQEQSENQMESMLKFLDTCKGIQDTKLEWIRS